MYLILLRKFFGNSKGVTSRNEPPCIASTKKLYNILSPRINCNVSRINFMGLPQN